MTHNHIPTRWDHPDVHRYEKNIALKIPGYHHLHEMTDRLMTASLPKERSQARVLVVGAGAGQEIVTLGERHAEWAFTGLDPSATMLEIAAKRAEQAGVQERISFVHGTVDQLSDELRYDAATCLLVLHFVRGIVQKRELLAQMAKRLKPGAPLFLAALSGEMRTEESAFQFCAWREHMLANGIPREEWERFVASIGEESDPVPEFVLRQLFAETGFAEPSRYFGAYLVDAWFAVKQ